MKRTKTNVLFSVLSVPSVLLILSILFMIPPPLQGQDKVNKKELNQELSKSADGIVDPSCLDEGQGEPVEWQGPVVQYMIEARLHPEQKKLTAEQVLTWVNTATVPVDHLRFHLYYNGFRNEKSTFLKEAKYYKFSKSKLDKINFGEIKIKELHLVAGENLTDKIVYISPDDANQDDRTVMEVKLVKAVEPGESINLAFEFELTIPQIFARTGRAGDYYFFGQWFPKIGVLQKDGVWHCHQFHRSSEFFADFGKYRVILTAPERFVVGATGNLVKTEKNADKSLTYYYEEENIHDFAWTAYPEFAVHTELIKLEGNKFDTTIELLIPQDYLESKNSFLDSLRFSLNYFAKHIYPYPYKKITVVVPPLSGIGSGGMEYPGLITSSYLPLLPKAFKMVEQVTIHEFGHEYWYGIIASDEFREAWLDEGVNSFFEVEIMDAYFKHSPSLLDWDLLPVQDLETQRLRYSTLKPVDPVNQYSWKFLNNYQYANNVYSKASIFLRSMQNLVGKEKMYGFFKYYAQKYKFKHPTSSDFIETFNTFMNDDYSWAFEMYIDNPEKLDHLVYSIESTKVEKDPVKYRNEVVFLRNEGYFPVELLIKLEDQREIKAYWKEKENWKRIVFHDPSPIQYAAIDPNFKVPLDYNYLNNSKVRKPDKSFIKRLAMKYGFFFQNVLGVLVF